MSREVEFRLARRLKGAEADTVTGITAESSAACCYGFELGGAYLVYASDLRRQRYHQLWPGLRTARRRRGFSASQPSL